MAALPQPPKRASEGMLYGWGRLGVPGRELVGEDLASLTRDVPLTRGLGRSYGDASLPPPDRPLVAGSRLADRILGFAEHDGVLHAEAGLSLRAINRLFLPRGFASPVMPGTQDVTLGGMVAADVHGKNHHRQGTFGRHLRRLRLRTATGRILWCSPEEEAELFHATIGGMGLTGHILEVEVALERIPSPWVYAESERLGDLDALLAALAAAAADWPFTVGWFDCLQGGRGLGRGILFRGRWAQPAEAPARPPPPRRRLRVPFDFPSWVLNRASMRLFNAAYYRKHPPWTRRGIVHPESFFHPLDAIRDWNRIYGRRGFTQYQCVLPAAGGAAAVRAFLERLVASGAASFLSVIKDCGEQGDGLLSFPLAGTSIALDLPVRDETPQLVAHLNAFVIEAGGRIYLAKDAFTRAADFRAMEPRLAAFEAVRRRWDPAGRLRSAQSFRLLGDGDR
ncbi:MAG: FAD-binding oxidoreductase [Acidobacteria bacterium]|nr:MAG: FAD-binding oxidoreductase [Acidobacteriota bacterium]